MCNRHTFSISCSFFAQEQDLLTTLGGVLPRRIRRPTVLLSLLRWPYAFPHRSGAGVASPAWSLGEFLRHIQGFPHKDVFVIAEEVDEHAFLFGGERSTNAYSLSLGASGVYEDLLGALGWFE